MKVEIIRKEKKYFARIWNRFFDYCGGYKDCMIYGAKTEQPYIKYESGYCGKTFLDDSMKEQLAALMA